MTSEHLSSAAEQLGAPEALVERSANARAASDGISPEEVLQAWAGGTPPSTVPTSAEAREEPAVPVVPPTEPLAPAIDSVAVEPPPVLAETPAPTPIPPIAADSPSQDAPTLVGRRESPLRLVAGALGLFLFAALFAFVLPALDATPAISPEIRLTADALQGREIYVAEGCWYCHTQQVRPIVTDAGLGSVTQSELIASIAPDTLGVQRIGPDLASAGSREPTSSFEWVESFLIDPQQARTGSLHASYSHLSDEDIHDLVHFVWESR